MRRTLLLLCLVTCSCTAEPLKPIRTITQPWVWLEGGVTKFKFPVSHASATASATLSYITDNQLVTIMISGIAVSGDRIVTGNIPVSTAPYPASESISVRYGPLDPTATQSVTHTVSPLTVVPARPSYIAPAAVTLDAQITRIGRPMGWAVTVRNTGGLTVSVGLGIIFKSSNHQIHYDEKTVRLNGYQTKTITGVDDLGDLNNVEMTVNTIFIELD